MSDKPVVGFVGVGLMGWGMAKNVVEKGWPLRVIAHRKREAVDDLVKRGAVEVATLAEMAAACDTVVLCVTGAPEVQAVVAALTGEGSAVRTIIDTSTSEPDVTARLAAALGAQGVAFIDAPLSRTPTHTWAGEATTYVSGGAASVEKYGDLLSAWASVVIPIDGPPGVAHAVKLVNNLVAIGYSALWSESYAMVAKLGVDPSTFREVITNSGMNCLNFQNFSKYPCEGIPDAHKFSLVNCLKDVRYYSRMADEHGAARLVSAGVLEMLKAGVNMGLGETFTPQMGDVLLRLNGDKKD
ncbi:MAG: 3-hydroxyisobutyrate dehydrogenase [Rhodobacterales bacterium CG18_big_fil_WC_8_21_14_2_50_71_9]|nr:MAG: 3-hydroxyisobutyrate dehydrogenase [Rhodobacterales bacterium CG18_big_fil_WC_8_21_14_2_50_71_9]PJA59312.1 MAG: NAD(P)-dependent oxidoreductase [Rhodobacterales bacterium CG_4_9_14_3_um_filter_71_31]